jgi:hypothetical protein
MDRAGSMHALDGNACKILARNPEGKIPLGRSKRKWEDNNKIDLTEIGLGDMDWIDLAQNRDNWKALVNRVMNILTP